MCGAILRHIALQYTEIRIHVAVQGHPQICNLLEASQRARRWLCVAPDETSVVQKQPTFAARDERVRHSTGRRPSRGPCAHTTPRLEMMKGSRRTPRTRFEKVSLCSKPILLALHSQKPLPPRLPDDS